MRSRIKGSQALGRLRTTALADQAKPKPDGSCLSLTVSPSLLKDSVMGQLLCSFVKPNPCAYKKKMITVKNKLDHS